jgi:hypothetical protein
VGFFTRLFSSLLQNSRFGTYLADALQSESKVEPVPDLYNAGCRDDVVDALVGVEGQVEQCEHRLIAGYIGGLEDGARGLPRLLWAEYILALSHQAFASDVIQITEANIGAALQAMLNETCTDSVGTSYIVNEYGIDGG